MYAESHVRIDPDNPILPGHSKPLVISLTRQDSLLALNLTGRILKLRVVKVVQNTVCSMVVFSFARVVTCYHH